LDYSKDYQIHYYHCDTKLNASVYSVIRILEDIAIHQSESLGVGIDYYHENKVGWMLTRWAIDINKLPTFGNTIKVITTPKAFNNFYANRWYRVLDSDENEIITAKTLWVFVNLDTRKPMTVTPEMYEKYDLTPEDKKHFSKLESIKHHNRIDYTKTFHVRLSDIDTNQHTNNSHYVSWALEALPPDFQQSKNLRSLHVNYLKETNVGDNLVSNVQIEATESTECLHSILNEDNVVCRIKSVWE
jgi:medium-chain acyl-[acyl-carrier-protein] hydrolase